jgi:UDP-glucuronate 4-epimerase
MRAIVTGAAGFIGFHVASRLLARGDTVFGVDSLDEYYSVSLKQARLAQLEAHPRFGFAVADISDEAAAAAAFSEAGDSDVVVHLAAQAGVRHSIDNPLAYVDANVRAQVVVFEQARRMEKRPSVVYASSSSVYGGNTKPPFSAQDRVDDPISVYAATKRAGELLARSYAHVHGVASTGLRFFTVYGPFGRPDMAPWLFTDAILKGDPISVFNHGNMARDFTFIDDVVDGVVAAVDRIVERPSGIAPVYNIGNGRPLALLDFIAAIEKATGRHAIRQLRDMPAADVERTAADISLAARDLGFHPKTPLEVGIPVFVEWLRDYKGY